MSLIIILLILASFSFSIMRDPEGSPWIGRIDRLKETYRASFENSAIHGDM